MHGLFQELGQLSNTQSQLIGWEGRHTDPLILCPVSSAMWMSPLVQSVVHPRQS